MVKRTTNSDLPDNKDLDRFYCAKIFYLIHKNAIVDVKSSGFGKLSITVKSVREANVILSDQSLESKGLIVYCVTTQQTYLLAFEANVDSPRRPCASDEKILFRSNTIFYTKVDDLS